MTRVSFHQGWTVRPKANAFASLAGPVADPRQVTIPHDALWDLPRSADAADGGHVAFFPGGAFEYEKAFEIPEEYRYKRVSVEFQGVYRDAMVFLNGAFVAQRPAGYSAFVVSLDDWLRPGEMNTLRVEARAHADSRWYSGAGIHRDVFLLVEDLVYVPQGSVRVTTPDIDEAGAVVEVVAEVVNASTSTATIQIRTEVLDPEGAVVAFDVAPATVRSGLARPVRQRLYVARPRLWSVDDPTLYSVRTALMHGTQTSETVATFGIRRLQVDALHGLRINGEVVKLRGACVHHDNGLLGAAAIGAADERRVALLKEAGFNAIRSAHNPMSPAMLDACDRLGVLVMDEAFDMWTEAKSSFDYSLAFPEWWERDLEALVRKDVNHPSVIMYSIGNEIFETGRPVGGEWSWKLAEKLRELDPTRFVTNGINGFVSVLSDILPAIAAHSPADDSGGGGGGVNSFGEGMNHVSASEHVTRSTAESFAALDIAGLNYGDARYAMDAQLFPNRVIVGSETFPSAIARNWPEVLRQPHVIGDFTWTGWDYLGEVGIGRPKYSGENAALQAPFPWLTAWCGDIDITGHRRPASYYREIVFGLRSTPYIAVRRPDAQGREAIVAMWSWSDAIASWTWDVPPGAPMTVEVYSDADEVELLLNGEPCGRRPVGPDHTYRAEFDVAFRSGRLEAVAYTSGIESGRTELRSAGTAVQLRVSQDRTQMLADHHDLCFVTVELCDELGELVTCADRSITACVEGPGTVVAVGSAQPVNPERFDTGTHTTFDGRALVIVRPTEPGDVTVVVSSVGLPDATVTLKVLAAGGVE